MYRGDGCIKLLKCHWTVYLSIVEMINFTLCIFYHNKIKLQCPTLILPRLITSKSLEVVLSLVFFKYLELFQWSAKTMNHRFGLFALLGHIQLSLADHWSWMPNCAFPNPTEVICSTHFPGCLWILISTLIWITKLLGYCCYNWIVQKLCLILKYLQINLSVWKLASMKSRLSCKVSGEDYRFKKTDHMLIIYKVVWWLHRCSLYSSWLLCLFKIFHIKTGNKFNYGYKESTNMILVL